MDTYNESNAKWWNEEEWNKTVILCGEVKAWGSTLNENVWAKGSAVFNTDASLYLFQHALIMIATSLVCFLLKPLRMTYIAQMIGGVVVGLIFPKSVLTYHKLLPPTIIYVLKIFAFLGFFLHVFLLGVETNMSALRRIGKKAITISFSGFFASGLFSYGVYKTQTSHGITQPPGMFRLAMLNAQTFFMVTCTHTNELGISNSDVGRLAASVSMVLDIFGMFATFSVFNIIIPFKIGGIAVIQPLIIIAHYTILFAVFRPLVIHIVNKTSHGSDMKQSHFVAVLAIALVIACLGELVDHRFSLFLFALTLPEEPLTTILLSKLDSITSGVFFPIYCSLVGLYTNAYSLTKSSYMEELVLIAGYAGKLVGTLVSSMAFGLSFKHAISLSLVMSSKGLFDIVTLFNWAHSDLIGTEEYTLAIFHILAFTGGVLPLVRLIYDSSSQYSAILRHTVMSALDNGNFQALVCIFKEKNLVSSIRLIESFHPCRAKPVPVTSLQLLQLTGRASFPILAPLHQVRSLAAFRSNLERCTRVVNGFMSLERETKGYARVQHYIAIAPFEIMHNDICNLAYEKNVSLLVLPFHVQWNKEGLIEENSAALREVNKLVFEKAPCSVALLIERGEWGSLSTIKGDFLRVAIIFIGGTDDHEALVYTKLFATNPNIRVMVVWVKPSNFNEEVEFEDCEAITNLINIFNDNNRISVTEIFADDGSQTTQFLVSMNDVADLVIVGRNHEVNYAPLFGLSQGWNEFQELGLLGSTLANPDFLFSVLIVQQEPRELETTDGEEAILI